MSSTTSLVKKRIFYFNITYGCNSNCIFCYSHNTHHNNHPYHEISFKNFQQYLHQNHLSSSDRIIINGGEPFLHTQILDILTFLIPFNCEVLIYTNGRLLSQFNFSFLTSMFRFIIPIHGYEELHDTITGVPGSYAETTTSMKYLYNNYTFPVDLKIILNAEMMYSPAAFNRALQSYDTLSFNNAVHITKMADTIISKRNHCLTLENEIVAKYTKKLFDYFSAQHRPIKLFDTCIQDLPNLKYTKMAFPISQNLKVYFKDHSQYREIRLREPIFPCQSTCPVKDFCISAVGTYRVLIYHSNQYYQSLE